MHKTLRRLPSLDFLRGFEAAGRRRPARHPRGRRALPHAIGAVAPGESARGSARHPALRAQAPRSRAHEGRRRVPSRGDRQAARAGGRRPDAVPSGATPAGLTVSTTVSFAALWLIPRLPAFRPRRARRGRLRLGGRSPGRPRARRRRGRGALSRPRSASPPGAVHLSASGCCPWRARPSSSCGPPLAAPRGPRGPRALAS